MAVKVRCPTCEKVLNAPDAARGKAIKCPGCETKVKVPVGDTPAGEGKSTARKSSGKTPSKKVADPDSSEFLARLDLDNVAHSDQAMCPKCGASIPEEATECPQCGVDPTTGQLTASAKKRRGMKGPNPALFYREAWTDSWAFVKENTRVGWRTFLYGLLFAFLSGVCNGMATWCSSLPPKVFWFVFYIAASLVMPGWNWFLTIETIRTTVGKKKLSLGKLNFDIFLCMALGIKMFLWIIVFSIFLPIPFALIMLPLAMIHMAMPVTKRGWLNFLMLPTFIRNIAPTLYFWVIAIVTTLPGLIVLVIPIVLFWPTLLELARAQNAEKFTVTTQMWIALGVTTIVILLVQLVNSFVLLFNARVIGLLAYYFQNSLDLTTFVAEKVYVHKAPKLDRFGVPIRTTGQKLGQVALIVGAFVAVGAAGYFVYRTLAK
jgi:ribosomal protein L40E/phage FluMu protein Com